MVAKETLDRLDFERIRAILADKCSTPGGRKLAMALAPCDDKSQAGIRFAQADEALLFPHALPLSWFADAARIMGKLSEEPYLDAVELARIARMLEGIGITKERLGKADPGRFTLLRELGDGLSSFEELCGKINRSVDPDGIRESAFPHLAGLRREMALERRKVLDTLEQMIQARPGMFQEQGVHYRDERLVLGVKREHEAEVEGLVHGISGGGSTVFTEPFEAVPGNNRVRGLKEQEREEVVRILTELTVMVADELDPIKESLEMVYELDFIFARAEWARRFDASAVGFDSDKFDIIGARHPLLMLKREVVPLDLRLDNQTRVLLVSGPNAGGKTVAVKTLGLSALCAGCGLHVPGSPDSTLPFFEDIYIDIGDEQSLDEDLSTFTAHLANLKRIIQDADEDSLVLLDELGVATSPEEGGALGMAVLSTLADKGARVVATTHLESLKYFVEEHGGMENAGMEFTDHPTYRLIMGIPGASNALKVAEELGFPPDVLEKAKGFIKPELLEAASLITRLSAEQRKAEELRSKLEGDILDLEEERGKYHELIAELAERKKSFDEELGKEREKVLQAARSRIEALVRRIKETQASKKAIKEAHAALKVGASSASSPELTRELTELSPGMKVYSKRLGREGVVLEENKDSALIQMGSLKLSLPLSDLSAVAQEPESLHQSKNTAPADIFNPRLSLRGMYADQAFLRLTQHVEEAVALGIGEVVIVHGKGTGVLSNLVRDYARKDGKVASFRVGEPGEGGDGVTVLRLAI